MVWFLIFAKDFQLVHPNAPCPSTRPLIPSSSNTIPNEQDDVSCQEIPQHIITETEGERLLSNIPSSSSSSPHHSTQDQSAHAPASPNTNPPPASCATAPLLFFLSPAAAAEGGGYDFATTSMPTPLAAKVTFSPPAVWNVSVPNCAVPR